MKQIDPAGGRVASGSVHESNGQVEKNSQLQVEFDRVLKEYANAQTQFVKMKRTFPVQQGSLCKIPTGASLLVLRRRSDVLCPCPAAESHRRDSRQPEGGVSACQRIIRNRQPLAGIYCLCAEPTARRSRTTSRCIAYSWDMFQLLALDQICGG
jgi:hypothetical protein